MRSRIYVLPAALALLLGGALGTSACLRAQPVCEFCRMSIPAETAASVEAGGTRHHVCDPRCALTHQQQTGQRTELVEVTDFETGQSLDPQRASFLSGSDTAPDAGQEALREATDSVYLKWHRCLPSVLAFGDRDAATRYQRVHGGRIQTLAELGFAGAAQPATPRN